MCSGHNTPSVASTAEPSAAEANYADKRTHTDNIYTCVHSLSLSHSGILSRFCIQLSVLCFSRCSQARIIHSLTHALTFLRATIIPSQLAAQQYQRTRKRAGGVRNMAGDLGHFCLIIFSSSDVARLPCHEGEQRQQLSTHTFFGIRYVDRLVEKFG